MQEKSTWSPKGFEDYCFIVVIEIPVAKIFFLKKRRH